MKECGLRFNPLEIFGDSQKLMLPKFSKEHRFVKVYVSEMQKKTKTRISHLCPQSTQRCTWSNV